MTYSFLWCIARELTDEDWKSKEAATVSAIGFALAAITLVIILVYAILVYATATSGSFLAISFLAISIAASGIGIGLFVLVGDLKISLFPGAYLHYRKRMKLGGV
jgi:uncharacterized protein with PQ loop repeat